MRYLSMILGAGLLLSALASSGPAHSAMPTLALDRSAVVDTLIEKAGYYYRRPELFNDFRKAITSITPPASAFTKCVDAI